MSSSDGDLDGYQHGCGMQQQQSQQHNHHHHHHHHHHHSSQSADGQLDSASASMDHHEADQQSEQQQQQQKHQSASARRRSSFGQCTFLPNSQLMYKEAVGSQDNLNGSTSPSLYDNCGQGGGGGGNSSRPGSVVAQERYDENITCCLPPPSPAPNSDRFPMGGLATAVSSNVHHYKDHRLMVHHRTMSPSSRYRSSMSERYRDISPNCDSYMMSSSHFLANSSPMTSSDGYTTYLSSTVHTPVKRYIPTPPPSSEQYAEMQTTAATLNSSGYHLSLPPTNGGGGNQIGSSQTLKPQKSRSQQQSQQQQYRIRMKCCPDQQQPLSTDTLQSQFVNDLVGSDHYATPPRMRNAKMQPSVSNTGTLTRQHQQNAQQSQQQQQTTQSPGSVHPCDYMSRTPSIEYIGSAVGRVITPINIINDQSSNSCLHCNTIRRTTGVHQTTQTTGPISPIPQPLSISSSSTNNSENGVGGRQSPISPPPSSSYSVNSLQIPLSISSSPNGSAGPPQSQQSQKFKTESPTSQQPPQNAVQAQAQPQQQSVPQPFIVSKAEPVVVQQQQAVIQQPSINSSNRSLMFQYGHNDSSSNLLNSTLNIQRNTLQQRQQSQSMRHSKKHRIKDYIKRETSKFFGVDVLSQEEEKLKWNERQKRLAVRRFGALRDERDEEAFSRQSRREQQGDRPDILPAQSTDETNSSRVDSDILYQYKIERKASVPTMIWNGIAYVVQTFSKKRPRKQKQWSRSFAPCYVKYNDDNDLCDGLTPIQTDETFFESPNAAPGVAGAGDRGDGDDSSTRQMYSANERTNGWRTKSNQPPAENVVGAGVGAVPANGVQLPSQMRTNECNGVRIASHYLDGVLDNSRRPITNEVRLLKPNLLDDRYDYRPFFTYWINTVHILVLLVSIFCYGVAPIGFGMEYKSGQVLVTSLSLQQVQHQEQRNVWIGPRSVDLVHLGAKFASCMRRDYKILDVIAKIKRQERETACCIRNDDSGCVQSSQADCSVRGLWPAQKTISTWKKWSPGDSGPGGRISGSVCGLDPKYCDAPASIAPYEWPDDITKWPICRKTNSFSHRFRIKDHTAEHMVCEVIGHPCCTGVYGECRITTKEYCDFVNGYFHEEASLCSQISCLNNVCGMFPFLSQDVPDQFYRIFTSLCLHVGLLHLAITVIFQHKFLSDLERLLGPLRTAIVYIGSGVAGNLTSAVLVPYRPEVGPLSSLAGILSSLSVMLTFCHWRKLKKPYYALIKLLLLSCALFFLSTLPWQQNLASLVAGTIFGTALTFALVPFINVTKYNRKSKINMIWACVLLHIAVYTAMIIIFYIFPALFSSFTLIGGAHPNDYFSTGQTGHYDHEHNNNLNINNNFGGYNNYNTGGGIVSSSGGTPPHHLNIGSSISLMNRHKIDEATIESYKHHLNATLVNGTEQRERELYTAANASETIAVNVKKKKFAADGGGTAAGCGSAVENEKVAVAEPEEGMAGSFNYTDSDIVDLGLGGNRTNASSTSVDDYVEYLSNANVSIILSNTANDMIVIKAKIHRIVNGGGLNETLVTANGTEAPKARPRPVWTEAPPNRTTTTITSVVFGLQSTASSPQSTVAPTVIPSVSPATSTPKVAVQVEGPTNGSLLAAPMSPLHATNQTYVIGTQ